MFTKELEYVSTQNDLAGSLAKAVEDVPVAEAAHVKAMATVASCEAERMRLLKVQGNLSAQAKHHRDVARKALKDSFDRLIDEKADLKGTDFRVYSEADFQFGRISEAIDYTSRWRITDVEEKLLRAELLERESMADLLDQSVCAQRLAAISAFNAAAAFDPGISLQFHGEAKDMSERSSWSDRTLREVNRIRTIDIPGLKSKLEKHRETTRLLREDSSSISSFFN
jgi:hypothetical protein